MCAYQSAKKHFSRDEIVEIIRKNVDLYKDDPNFSNYIVDLSLYLIEYAYKKEPGMNSFPEKSMDFITSSVGHQKVYKVFRSPSTGDTGKFCPFCGAPVKSHFGKCDQCGNVI